MSAGVAIVILFFVLLIVGAWGNGVNKARANQYLADKGRAERKARRRR